MAIDQASYRPIRFITIEKAIYWCQNVLNLRDWTVSFSYGDVPEAWCDTEGCPAAQSRAYAGLFQADIWISPKGCKRENFHPVSVAIHEMLHIFFHHYTVQDHDDRMINTLELLLFKQWLAEHPRR